MPRSKEREQKYVLSLSFYDGRKYKQEPQKFSTEAYRKLYLDEQSTLSTIIRKRRKTSTCTKSRVNNKGQILETIGQLINV